MSLILTVDERRWRAHVDEVWAAHPGVVPVVKGTGYGLGRRTLTAEAARRGAAYVAVGTIGELDGLTPGSVPVVLSPTARARPGTAEGAILTVTREAEVVAAAEAGAAGVVVELASSMHRTGTADPAPVLALAGRHRLRVVAAGLHLPLAGTADARADEAARWLPRLPAALPLWCSHLDAADERALAARHPVAQRIGTRLWLGDKSPFHLGADVVAVHAVAAGTPCGYRQLPVPADGHVVVVGAGTVQGVTLLPDGRSPLHHARRRLALVEPPHQHATMAFVPAGEPCPAVGDVVDVQRPLTEVRVDELIWR